MSEVARSRAAAAQRTASNPGVSAWVDASAGSGKTKVLTDRVLRLLLEPGQRPERLLCLTFTKAAAAEMANRLNARLGGWAVAGDPDLTKALVELTGNRPDAAMLLRARKLFADVLDLPGGMRISTIHAFAQGLLRGFPIEAKLPPRFRVAEDAERLAITAAARDAALSGEGAPSDALARLAGETDGATLDRAIGDALQKAKPLPKDSVALAALNAALTDWLGLDPEDNEDAVLARMALVPDAVRQAAAGLVNAKTKTERGLGEAMRAWLALPDAARAARLDDWSDALLTQKGELRSILEKHPAFVAEAARLDILRAVQAGLRLRATSIAFAALAGPVRAAYDSRKTAAGLLDFDDLIAAAQDLLRDPGSAWVLFRLDGGLDHLLLDESQDTNAAQWAIAGALAGEFFSGTGPRESIRTIFAVGDPKQSIFAFQGADPAGFTREKAHFAAEVTATGQRFEEVALDVSFRSTAPVLALVDAVFIAPEAAEGVTVPGTLMHVADRAGQAGQVELWPLLLRQKSPPPTPWDVPLVPVSLPDTIGQCAEAVAVRIAAMVGTEFLPSRGRTLRAGDVLVLVRRRHAGFLTALTRGLKARGVPVGGVDRLALTEQLAVMDLLALCDVLLQPDDDLALASVLTSPLVGLDEDSLFALAHRRQGSLWAALMTHRAGQGPLADAAEWLARAAARAVGATPHLLLAGLLAEDGARARLLARLGPEAADPLDELLNAALADERNNPPDLQGFLHRLRGAGAMVKREAESGADAVRIMTVHNAKGLQAPLVILPDVGPGGRSDTLRWAEHGGVTLPIFTPRPAEARRATAFAALDTARAQATKEEENRLLYVALTRAEDRLIVCGWQPAKGAADWHAKVATGFAALEGVDSVPFDWAPPGSDTGGQAVLRLASAQTDPPRDDRPAESAATAILPAWASVHATDEAPTGPFAPSGLPGEEETPTAAPHGKPDPTGERFRRGRLVHALLQHLPDHPPAAREALGRDWLAKPGQGIDPKTQAGVLAEAMAVLEHPGLAEAFGPDSLAEAPLAGRIGGRLLAGQVDRLLVTDHRVVVVDYKTNRPPPELPEAVAPVYLRQMAAYRALLRQTFPDRMVEAWLVWTYGARPMPLPEPLLDAHAP
ncbi:double-strand break repair helicase AddA [Humitalea sp. 24SJ18S-53]|uniref:double-strand break repair helicase AddA n=1 Tax=Humitalea sp. 24SJ18S-53 TaxID=3422307 RepID=UPI003D66820A